MPRFLIGELKLLTMKYEIFFKIGVYKIYALVIIMFGTLLRVLLVALKWPLLNSDEGIMGIMALHIADHGEHPIFYYGQNYMGALDAYIGASLFQVFGSSISTLRFSIILLYIPFMAAMYFLTSALYTKRLALGSLVLLSLGSIPILILEVSPIVYPDILFFGASAFLLATWLTLSYNQDIVQHRHWLRLLGYACWGCVAGLAVWSDPLILPYLASASLLLVVFCWREMIFKLGGICLLLGLVVGASPLIMYNLKASPGQDSLSIFLRQTHPATSVPGSPIPLSMHIVNTILYNIPTATGNPLCPLVFSQGPVNAPGLRCVIVHASWSLGLIVLWLVAVFLAIMTLWKLKHDFRGQLSSSEQKCNIIRRVCPYYAASQHGNNSTILHAKYSFNTVISRQRTLPALSTYQLTCYHLAPLDWRKNDRTIGSLACKDQSGLKSRNAPTHFHNVSGRDHRRFF